MRTLVYATRKSQLALAQSRAFVATLVAAHPGLSCPEHQVITTGDRIQDRPLSEVGGKGLFVKEIEEALLDKTADLAVHSIKDVPAELPPGLGIVCVPRREQPFDVLVAPRHGSLAALPQGAVVGTSSLRRSVALKRVRPDLRIVALRGNVDTRLRKVDEGECDAILLARAGLSRLGLEARITETLGAETMLPAVGQGALGIEARADDEETIARLGAVSDVESHVCVWAERGVLRSLDGDCRTPIGAYARREGQTMWLRAFIAEPDGSKFREGERKVPYPASADEAFQLGIDLGRDLASR
jgi:hydroxymethylbilane synthase